MIGDGVVTRSGVGRIWLSDEVFADTVGKTPAYYMRLTRFLKACKEIRANGHQGMTPLAHDQGFYDHAHLVHEFDYFCAMTPTKFRDLPEVYFDDLE